MDDKFEVRQRFALFLKLRLHMIVEILKAIDGFFRRRTVTQKSYIWYFLFNEAGEIAILCLLNYDIGNHDVY